MLPQIQSKPSLLILTLLQKGEVDAKVELFKLMLSSQSNLIQASRVIAILFMNNVGTINPYMHLFIHCQSAVRFVIRF